MDLSADLVALKKSTGLTKKLIIKVINQNNYAVEVYGVGIYLFYKEGSKNLNIESSFDIKVSIYKFVDSNIVLSAINISFVAVLLYSLFLAIERKPIVKELGFPGIIVIITFIAQLYFRFRYVKSPILYKSRKREFIKNIIKHSEKAMSYSKEKIKG